jgi:hypothetical protein
MQKPALRNQRFDEDAMHDRNLSGRTAEAQ